MDMRRVIEHEVRTKTSNDWDEMPAQLGGARLLTSQLAKTLAPPQSLNVPYSTLDQTDLLAEING
jgi:hypothetical protein